MQKCTNKAEEPPTPTDFYLHALLIVDFCYFFYFLGCVLAVLIMRNEYLPY